MQKKTVKVEAVDLSGVNVLEDGIAPSISIMSEDGGKKPAPTPTEPDTLPG
jgi:hypothetical protein